MEHELKINARGLSGPGARMMVENALSKGTYKSIRVVVNNSDAVDNLRDFFSEKNARVKVDQVGEEFHVFVELDV
jgi:TusA-related sulfurtransferase